MIPYSQIDPEAYFQLGSDRFSRVWMQSTPPGTTYRWTGTPNNSTSEKVVNGEVVATNHARTPKDRGGMWSGGPHTDVNEYGVLILAESTYSNNITAAPGDIVSGSFDLWSPNARTMSVSVRGTASQLFGSEPLETISVDVVPGEQRVVTPDLVLPETSDGFRLLISDIDPANGVRINNVLMMINDDSDYFDGDMEYEPVGTYYRWAGGLSQKVVNGETVGSHAMPGFNEWTLSGGAKVEPDGTLFIGDSEGGLAKSPMIPVDAGDNYGEFIIDTLSPVGGRVFSIWYFDSEGAPTTNLIGNTGNGSAGSLDPDVWHLRPTVRVQCDLGPNVAYAMVGIQSSHQYKSVGNRYRNPSFTSGPTSGDRGADSLPNPFFNSNDPDYLANDLWSDGNLNYTWNSSTNAWESVSAVSPTKNLQGRPEYQLSLTSPRPTTSVAIGRLSAMIVDDALLTVPYTRKFGMSLLARPYVGDIVRFGEYVISYDGGITLKHGDDILGQIALIDDKTRRWSVSFDGESISIRIDDEDLTFPAPVDEAVESIELLAGGGILDSILYWSRPITKFEHQSLMESNVSLPDPYPLVKMVTDEMFMYPVTKTLYPDTNPALDTNAIGWVPVFNSDSRFTSNYAPIESGEFIYVFPEETGVEGEVSITEFLDGHIYMDPYVEINVGAVGPGELSHPVWRSAITGSRGEVAITPIEEAEPLAAVSFWMDPFEGEIMPGVTMTGGVVSGASYINGQEYSGTPIEDRFMVTVNNPSAEFTINPDITNFMTSETALSHAQARELYESFFILPAIKTLHDTVPVSEGSVFTIDATWGIVTSG